MMCVKITYAAMVIKFLFFNVYVDKNHLDKGNLYLKIYDSNSFFYDSKFSYTREPKSDV